HPDTRVSEAAERIGRLLKWDFDLVDGRSVGGACDDELDAERIELLGVVPDDETHGEPAVGGRTRARGEFAGRHGTKHEVAQADLALRPGSDLERVLQASALALRVDGTGTDDETAGCGGNTGHEQRTSRPDGYHLGGCLIAVTQHFSTGIGELKAESGDCGRVASHLDRENDARFGSTG